MENWVHASVQWLLTALALPEVGLPAIFLISLVSATLLPLGSEPAVFGFVKIAPHMFWPAVCVATVGNTLGGIISYGMGLGAEKTYEHWRHTHEGREIGGRWHVQINQWVRRFGPPAMFFSWLPVVGDPLCAVAGWLRLPFWPSVGFMALGKFVRYAAMTAALLWVF